MKSHSFRSFAVLMLVASGSWAQGQVKSQPLGRPSATLTIQEKSKMQNTALSDARTQQILGAGQPRVMVSEAQVDKYEAQAFLRGDTEKPPTHRIHVLMFNPKTNKAAHAFVSLEGNSIVSVREIDPVDAPLFPEDAVEALALAKASPDVRSVVGSSLDKFVIITSGSDAGIPFAAQASRIHSIDPSDPCSTDRCLDLIFRTGGGYLPVRADVDLTNHTLVVRKSQQGKGKHP